MRFYFAWLALGVAAIVSSTSTAQIVDIRPRVEEGEIVIGGFADSGSQGSPDQRHFLYSFGDFSEDPYFATEPGVNVASGSGFAGGTDLRFNVLDGSNFSWSSNLVYWDGLDFNVSTPLLDANFSRLPAGESLRLEIGSSSLTVGAALGEQEGFTIQRTSASGAIHRHFSSYLQSGDTPAPSPGIYLMALEFTATDLKDSLPTFLLFANEVSANQRQTAMAWVENRLVNPLPGDANYDGRVNLVDFSVLRRNFGSLGEWHQGDFDANGRVEIADFSILRKNFGATRAAVAAPEPSGVWLLAALFPWLTLNARQRS